jgi:hypothetical protein
MLYAAIDIHKHAFQAAVLDPDSGVVVEERFAADRGGLARWAEQWRGRVAAVAIEATTGWRWVWRELVADGFEVRALPFPPEPGTLPPPLWNEPSPASPTRQPAPQNRARQDRHGLHPNPASVQTATTPCDPHHP